MTSRLECILLPHITSPLSRISRPICNPIDDLWVLLPMTSSMCYSLPFSVEIVKPKKICHLDSSENSRTQKKQNIHFKKLCDKKHFQKICLSSPKRANYDYSIRSIYYIVKWATLCMEKLKLTSFFSFLMLSLFKVKIRLTLVDVEGFHFNVSKSPRDTQLLPLNQGRESRRR